MTEGTFVLFGFAALLGISKRAQDRPWFGLAVAGIFLALAVFWQMDQHWVGVNAAFVRFVGLHGAAIALGFILGCIGRVLYERRRIAG